MRGRAIGRGVGILVVSFNTAAQTLRCLESLARLREPPEWVLVLDNASSAADFERLRRGCAALPESELSLYRADDNLGFAGGSNFLIERLLLESGCRLVGLLNNDAVAQPDLVGALADALDENAGAGLAGGRMHRLHRPEEVDTLGISIYASLMPADRKRVADVYLGPPGGCWLMTRDLVEALRGASGYCFDDRYFCYCEDTDLVLRAVLLGYTPVYVDRLVALHEGQASSGGKGSRFIAYHGLRNLMWMQVKLLPGATLLKYLPLLLVAHVLSFVKLLLNGQPFLPFVIYRDAWKRFPEFAVERRAFARRRRISASGLDAYIVPGFYRHGYLSESILDLLARYLKWGRRSGVGP